MRHISSFPRVAFTQSARKHRIGRRHARYVMDNTMPLISKASLGSQEEWRWVGPDDRGVVLEILGIVIAPDSMLVIHVMPHSFRRSS